MGQHRRTDTSEINRGISKGVWVGITVFFLVLVIGIAWMTIADRTSRDEGKAAGRCVKGNLDVTIISDPELTTPLTAVAKKYNATTPIARDHCVTVKIRSMDAVTALQGLTGTWDVQSNGQVPGAWIPQSSLWSAQLIAARNDRVDGVPESLVNSPIVIAGGTKLVSTLTGKINWSDLAALQAEDASLRKYGLPNWGSLRLSMPLGPQSDASYLLSWAVAQAHLTGNTVTPLPAALTLAQTKTDTIHDVIRQTIAGGPQSVDGSSVGALLSLAKNSDATGRIHTVAVTEQLLYSTKKLGGQPVAALRPQGPTPFADYPVIRLKSGILLDSTADGVDDFLKFLQLPEQLTTFTDLGFRTSTKTPNAGSDFNFPTDIARLATPESAAIIQMIEMVRNNN